MKQHKELNVFDVNIAEIKCLKNKNLLKCQTQKCFTFKWYSNQGFPCPYYLPPNNERCFSGNLNDIKGLKIRRMYFNVWIYILLLLLVMMIVTEALLAKSFSLALQSLLEIIIYMSIMTSPFFILSFLNKRLFGRLVCVVNENGLYCNQKALRWTQINRVTYDIDIPGKRKMAHSSIKIDYDSGLILIIPYAPRNILKTIKMYCPNIKVGLNASSKFLVGIFVSLPILIPIFIFLIKGH